MLYNDFTRKLLGLQGLIVTNVEEKEESILIYAETERKVHNCIRCGIAGCIGIILKNIYKKYVENKIKKDVAKTVVGAVEQIYKDLHGQEKYEKAVEAMVEMLAEKGISISELEIKMLIDSAVNEFNKSVKGEGEVKAEGT